eukprot:GHVO01059042.1.p2 GENE.GHVO01059042.1~~GHVO01059042.1.p2  ORF type:complete len:117 (-),score=9.59 GHVO01059042.1:76-426(-)
MHDEHGERSDVENPGLKTDVENDQFNQSFTAHQRSNRSGLPQVETRAFRSGETGKEFRTEGNNTKEDRVPPGYPGVERPEVGSKARKSKVEWQKKDGDNILNFLCYGKGITIGVRD